ncbi:lytic transglycosylase domain-containing protein [Streptomyces massasporeus]|uniref:lytic transglycosylase domain-containing protein n=1 Tax=Streptomyces massasporeus TaxID=67324 RepID=UPI00379401B5
MGGVVVVIIIGGLGVIFAPLIALILFFGGGGGGGGQAASTDEIVSVFEGDGLGELDPDSVPPELLDAIEEAGALCPDIGPVVIAAQIDEESGFDPGLVGPDGEQGISQLPPPVFEQFGEDDDDSGETSPFDTADSILAQGRYLCSLVEEVRPLTVPGQRMQDVLSLALAAYDVGPEAVSEADGVPRTSRSQNYVLNVRANFASYEGLVDALPPGDEGGSVDSSSPAPG